MANEPINHPVIGCLEVMLFEAKGLGRTLVHPDAVLPASRRFGCFEYWQLAASKVQLVKLDGPGVAGMTPPLKSYSA